MAWDNAYDKLLNFGPFFDHGHEVWLGFLATIRLSVMSGVLALVLGTLLVAMRVSPVPVMRSIASVYVNVLRNTPLTLVLLFCGLGLRDTLGFMAQAPPAFSGYWLSVAGLSAYTAAFVCETLRSGINTVPIGQAEAARSIGLTFTQSLCFVILPQSFRAVIAPLGSVFLAKIKNTSVALVVGFFEAAATMKQLFDDIGGTVPVFLGFAAGYMILTLPTGLFFGWLAKRMAVLR
ncbi:MAG: amino acid ABC transporter permease [Mycobacteriales bacterium]